MNRSFSLSARTLRLTASFTALFSLLAHGYRFLNMSFSGDAAQISLTDEMTFQIAIGRFLQPVLWQIRGAITAPLTIGLFATAALIGAAFLLITMLSVQKPLSIALICGILATNETLGVSYATYLPWADVYMVAFFFAMAGVYASVRWRHGWLLSPVFYFISLGLYQSYIQTAAALIILLLMLRLLGGERPGVIWLEGIKACLALVASLLLYYLAISLVPQLLGVDALNHYNSARNATVIFLEDIPELLVQTYLYPFQFFMRAASHAFFPPVITLALLVLGLPALLTPAGKLSLPGKLTLLFLIAVLPLGANFTTVISKGIVHPLMVYAFYFLYVLIIVLWERQPLPAAVCPRTAKGFGLFRRAVSLLCALMIALNILTANQLYLRRDLEFYSTTSAATRILKHADNVEGYVPGETPVCVLGYLPSSKISLVRPGFESLSNLQGMRYTYAASYETATPWYFQMILGYPVNFVSADEQQAYAKSGIGDSLPSFPDEGCYQMIDGTLFIKLN